MADKPAVRFNRELTGTALHKHCELTFRNRETYAISPRNFLRKHGILNCQKLRVAGNAKRCIALVRM